MPGESATVVVEVRSIASRPVRRRGMRPLVEATVADDTGAMKATFFNQPWLVQRYPPGTRLVLHGKYEARNRFRVQAHAPTGEAAAGGGGRPLPGQRGPVLDPDPGAGARARGAIWPRCSSRCPRGCACASGCADRPRALRAAHFPTREPEASGRRRLAFDELLLAQLALLRRRASAPGDDARAPVLDGRAS